MLSFGHFFDVTNMLNDQSMFLLSFCNVKSIKLRNGDNVLPQGFEHEFNSMKLDIEGY